MLVYERTVVRQYSTATSLMISKESCNIYIWPH